jgi:hypothetical protein
MGLTMSRRVGFSVRCTAEELQRRVKAATELLEGVRDLAFTVRCRDRFEAYSKRYGTDTVWTTELSLLRLGREGWCYAEVDGHEDRVRPGGPQIAIDVSWLEE